MNTDRTQQPDVGAILLGLQSDDSDVVRAAAFDAADQCLAEAVDPLCRQVQSGNIGVQEAAEYALRKIRGTRTIRALLPLLRSEDPPIRNIAMDVLREIGCDDIAAIQPLLRDADPDMRIFMADILGCTGSRQAVPLLCEALLKDPEVNVRYQAAVSLGSLAFPEAVDSLRQAMQDEEWVQFSVVEALAKIRDDSTVSTLTQALSVCSELVASVIVEALGEMGNLKAVPLLLKSLEKASPPLRHKTVKAIVRILGGRSLSLLSSKERNRFREYLLDALNDEDEDVQLAALSGLGFMGDAEASRRIMNLARQLDPDRSQHMLDAATKALAAIGYNESFAHSLASDDSVEVRLAVEACALMSEHCCVEHLKNSFHNLDRDTQRLASRYMAGHAEERDIPFFMEALRRNTDGDVLKNAVYFLGVRMKCVAAQDQIFELLSHKFDDVKDAALQACIELRTPELNARFKNLFLSDDAVQRLMAVYALSRYGLEDNLAELFQALEDESPIVRQYAVEAFGLPGVDAMKYMDRLLPRLCDESRDVRAMLFDLLGQRGNEEIIPHLVAALNDEDEWVRIRAVEALGALKNEKSAPQLLQLLENASPLLALKVIDVLGSVGGNVAFRALLGMMDHEDPEIQHAAAEALSKIKDDQE